MRLLLGFGSIIALTVVAATPVAARDLTSLEAVGKISEGYDPFRAPKRDRLPDDYVDGKPYWLPTPPQTAITREMVSSPAASAMAADIPVGYDPYRRPAPDRVPDDYVDGRPYWLPGPELVRTPTGFVGYSMWEAEFGGRYSASTGQFRFDLFADPPGGTSQPASRLTYRDLSGYSGELFGRIDHATGLFVKGFPRPSGSSGR